MPLCRLMINNFQGYECESYEKYPTGFDDYDLRCGIAWARELLQEGFTHDTWFNIDLRIFIKWCQHKLRS